MSTVRKIVGIAAFWLLWPGLYIYLNNSRRSRLVVVSGNQALVVRGWLGDGSWSLPGGGIHKGESGINSAARELKEETGISVESSQVKPLDQFDHKHRGIAIKIEAFYTKLSSQTQAKAQFGEIAEVKWQKISELLDKEKLSPDTRLLLTKKQW